MLALLLGLFVGDEDHDLDTVGHVALQKLNATDRLEYVCVLLGEHAGLVRLKGAEPIDHPLRVASDHIGQRHRPLLTVPATATACSCHARSAWRTDTWFSAWGCSQTRCG